MLMTVNSHIGRGRGCYPGYGPADGRVELFFIISGWPLRVLLAHSQDERSPPAVFCVRLQGEVAGA